MTQQRAARAGVVDLAGFLRGPWWVEREILDASPRAQSGHFTGWATFTPDDRVAGLLRYVEHGTVELGSHRGPAVRRLGYHLALAPRVVGDRTSEGLPHPHGPRARTSVRPPARRVARPPTDRGALCPRPTPTG